MASFDRCRRAASIVLVMACFVLAPGIARAQFTSTRAPSQSIGTDTMEVLTGVTGTFTCSRPGQSEAISFNVTGFTDTGPTGATYTFTILKAGVVKAADTSLTHAKILTFAEVDDHLASTWTLTIRAGLSSWTGPVVTKSAACNIASTTTGTL